LRLLKEIRKDAGFKKTLMALFQNIFIEYKVIVTKDKLQNSHVMTKHAIKSFAFSCYAGGDFGQKTV